MKALKRTLCSILICMLMMTNMAYAMPAISENSVASGKLLSRSGWSIT